MNITKLFPWLKRWGFINGFCAITCAHNSHAQSPDASGTVLTIAGSELYGFAGDGGPATKASFRDPNGVALGPDGTLNFAETSNYRIRAIAPATGIIATGADLYIVTAWDSLGSSWDRPTRIVDGTTSTAWAGGLLTTEGQYASAFQIYRPAANQPLQVFYTRREPPAFAVSWIAVQP